MSRLVITFTDDTTEEYDQWSSYTVMDNGQVLTVEFAVGSMESPRKNHYPLASIRHWKMNPR